MSVRHRTTRVTKAHHIQGPTWVYTLESDGPEADLLYVGITCHLQQRLKQHRSDKPWWPEVALVQASLYGSRAEALAHEAGTIRVFRPAHNLHIPVGHHGQLTWHPNYDTLRDIQVYPEELSAWPVSVQ